MSKQPKKRASYSAEYREEVIRMCREPGRSPHSVANDLGLTRSMVAKWVQAATEARAELSLDERAELQQLRREVRTLRQDREILRKATVLFAKGAAS